MFTPLDDRELDDLMNVQRGTWRVVRTNGTIELRDTKPTTALALTAIGADTPDTVNLRHDSQGKRSDTVMLVDDTGHQRGRPFNMIATQLYHRRCVPGTTHTIVGDVALVNDNDFGDASDYGERP
jgi:hypothetical protein